jgi:diaminopimelate decarboxylase
MSPSKLAPAWLEEPTDLNGLDSRLWPESTSRSRDGAVHLGGVDSRQLLEQFGSPLYVVDLDTLRSRARSVQSTLRDAISREARAVHVYYATKALLTSDVVRAVAAEGLGFDVSTSGECEWVLSSGVDPSLIEYQGNNKSLPEIRRALEVGVGAVVIDSEWEARRLAEVSAELGRTQRVMIRVNSGVHAGTHDYLATAREDQKFGIARGDIPAVAEIVAAAPQLELAGLHSHIGSQIVSPDGFIEATHRLLAEYEKLQADHPMDTVNLGGGFAIPYTPSDPDSNLEAIAQALGVALDEWALKGVSPSIVAFEPGRIISGPAGVTLYTVGTTKQVVVGDGDESDTRLYVSVDGGMSDNLRTALYGANYTVRLASRSSDASPALVRVVGKHCESGDIVVTDDYLPGDVTPGDVLIVAQTGAYCHSLSSNYNAVGRPALVVLEGGEARVSLSAETVEDVMSRDIGLALGSQAPGRV